MRSPSKLLHWTQSHNKKCPKNIHFCVRVNPKLSLSINPERYLPRHHSRSSTQGSAQPCSGVLTWSTWPTWSSLSLQAPLFAFPAAPREPGACRHPLIPESGKGKSWKLAINTSLSLFVRFPAVIVSMGLIRKCSLVYLSPVSLNQKDSRRKAQVWIQVSHAAHPRDREGTWKLRTTLESLPTLSSCSYYLVAVSDNKCKGSFTWDVPGCTCCLQKNPSGWQNSRCLCSSRFGSGLYLEWDHKNPRSVLVNPLPKTCYPGWSWTMKHRMGI